MPQQIVVDRLNRVGIFRESKEERFIFAMLRFLEVGKLIPTPGESET